VLERGLKLTSLRRDILSSLTSGHGESPDELRRKVALRRGLVPSAARWPSFSVSFARALRVLEEKGALEVRRESMLFQKPCMSWVSLTALGESERERAFSKHDGSLGTLATEAPLAAVLRARISQASERELEVLSAIVAAEHERRTRSGSSTLFA
jgi:hypothetical protein